jgi:BirA family biotin operon repressor/biotin-[acetyl-CoA-carboxylase] ligase
MAAAIAAAEVLQRFGLAATLKWPNDVLVNGKKICGILAEGTAGGVIIGIGLNVNMGSAGHIDQPATSLLLETGKRHAVDKLLDSLLSTLSVRLEEWNAGGFAGIRRQWEANVPNIGQEVTVWDGDQMRTGLLAGFGSRGELLLRDISGTVSPVWAGDLSAC